MRTENYLYVIGASKPSQIESNVDALYNLNFTKEELEQIDKNLKSHYKVYIICWMRKITIDEFVGIGIMRI